MSILIKGMEMPKNCDKCRFQSAFKLYCDAMPYNFCGNTDDIERPDWCPLIELPPRGNLKDESDIISLIEVMFCKDKDGMEHAIQCVKDADTVIEAEGERMMDEEIRQAVSEVREMKQMCGNINMKLTNIVTQRGQNWKEKLEGEYQRGLNDAWEAARKIVLSPDEGGTSLTDIYVMFGNNGSMQRVFRSYSASEVIEKLKYTKRSRR